MPIKLPERSQNAIGLQERPDILWNGDLQFRGEKYRRCVLHWRQELLGALDTLFLQSTNLELAVFSESTDVAEQQLASLLITVRALFVSLPSIPGLILKPILRAIAATDSLTRDSLSPSARVAEAALLGFACLAAAEFQVTQPSLPVHIYPDILPEL